MPDKWIAYEAAARGIARERRGEGREPTKSERLLARIAVDEAMPYLDPDAAGFTATRTPISSVD
jgi:hypothetical protein